MPEETQTKKLEPEELETYRCPKCKNKLECSLGKAREHVDIPVDSGLPVGAVFENQMSGESSVRAFHLIYSLPEGELDINHEYAQWEYVIFSRAPNQIDIGRYCFKVRPADIKNKLKKGHYKPIRLEELKKHFGDELNILGVRLLDYNLSITISDLIDPTPELEALVKGEGE